MEKEKTIICEDCGKEVPIEETINGICYKCNQFYIDSCKAEGFDFLQEVIENGNSGSGQ